MIRVYENDIFTGFVDRDSGSVFSDIEFRRCTFVNCDISVTNDPARRTTVRNIRLVDCIRKRDPAGFQSAFVEDCLVENLRTEDLLQTWGTAFRHVTLRGRMGRLMMSASVLPSLSKNQAVVRAFEEANAAYYADVDWALDISQAEFVECDIRGIPADLIRRDPETQVVVRREKALLGIHKTLPFTDKLCLWAGSIDLFLETGDADLVLVAPKLARDFASLLHGLRLLRDAGVAEPD